MPEPTTTRPRTWLITGVGRGLGRAFADAALDRGDRVAGTVRDPTAAPDLADRHGDRFLPLTLDVRDRHAVTETVERALDTFGELDVLVNNAGYGYVSAIEEASERGARDQLETNLFGALWATQAVLPHMRARGDGDIVQISTVGAVGTMPTFGLYNASKWALEAFSEALAKEIAPHGVRVTIAELGGFATDWGGSSLQFAEPVAAYDELRTAIFGSAAPWEALAAGGVEEPGRDDADDDEARGDRAAGAEPGDADPAVAAQALLAHLDAEDRPLRLLVGDDATEQAAMALAARRDDYRRNPGFTWPA